MKKIALLIVLITALVSCTKELPAPVKKTENLPTGTFVFRNHASSVYRVEVFRYNNNSKPADFYTLNPNETMIIPKSIAGKYVIGIMKVGTDTSHDYGFEVELKADCFFEYIIN